MSRHIEIDRELCNGYGNCVVLAPDVFDLDPGTGIAHVREGHPTAADEQDIESAVADCPARAILWRA